MTCVQDKENDSESEKIDNVTGVWFMSQNFWSHVVSCSKDSLKFTTPISTFNWSSESKIRNFYVKLIVK